MRLARSVVFVVLIPPPRLAGAPRRLPLSLTRRAACLIYGLPYTRRYGRLWSDRRAAAPADPRPGARGRTPGHRAGHRAGREPADGVPAPEGAAGRAAGVGSPAGAAAPVPA